MRGARLGARRTGETGESARRGASGGTGMVDGGGERHAMALVGGGRRDVQEKVCEL